MYVCHFSEVAPEDFHSRQGHGGYAVWVTECPTILINHGWVRGNGYWPRHDAVFLDVVFYSICVSHLSEAHEADRCLTGSWVGVRKGEANPLGQKKKSSGLD